MTDDIGAKEGIVISEPKPVVEIPITPPVSRVRDETISVDLSKDPHEQIVALSGSDLSIRDESFVPEEPRKTKDEAIQEATQDLEKFGIQETEDGIIDLSTLSSVQISTFFDNLVASGAIVLHGSNSEKPYSELLARRANDAAKESGNQRAVYATTDPNIALMRAAINKEYLGKRVGTYSFGEDYRQGRMGFKATPNVYELFLEHDANVVSSGYMYILDRDQFSEAKDAKTEFSANNNQLPLLICKVPAQIGEGLFITGQGQDIDTVFPYTEVEMVAIEEHNKKQRIIGIDQLLTPFFQDNQTLTGRELVSHLTTVPELQTYLMTDKGKLVVSELEHVSVSSKEVFLETILKLTSPN